MSIDELIEQIKALPARERRRLVEIILEFEEDEAFMSTGLGCFVVAEILPLNNYQASCSSIGNKRRSNV